MPLKKIEALSNVHLVKVFSEFPLAFHIKMVKPSHGIGITYTVFEQKDDTYNVNKCGSVIKTGFESLHAVFNTFKELEKIEEFVQSDFFKSLQG